MITGSSGSGKSLAAKCFEDLGYFCVDNLPVSLILPFCALIQRGAERVRLAALVIDAREGAFLEQFPEMLLRLRETGIPVQLLFFDCSDEVLKRRFSETRRPHPMAADGETLDSALAQERRTLAPLREMADRIIDTTKFTSHELRSFLSGAYGTAPNRESPNVNVVSFGFKYGIPSQADLLFDVRFLPNPYFVEELRYLDGRSGPVQEYLDRNELTEQFMSRLRGLLDFLIPLYAAEGKTYLTIAIGCTGGKHRSVALAERLGAGLGERGSPTTVSHRDLGKE